VNGVNKRFHMFGIGELRNAVAEIENMAVSIFVMGEFSQYTRGLTLNDCGRRE
jgi:hypothetical protein